MSNRNSTLRGAVYGLTAAAIWGGLYVVSDIVLKTVPPFTLLTVRLLLAAAVLGIAVWLSPGRRLPARADTASLLGVGIVGFGLSVGAQFVGTDKSTAVNGALVTSAAPAFILVFAALILHEKLTVQRLLAVVMASFGVVVIIDPARADFNSETFAGDLALAAAAVTWGLYSVLVRRFSRSFSTTLISLYSVIGGLIIAVPACLLELSVRTVGSVDGGTIAGILYLGVISTAGAMWLWNRAFALMDASAASLFFFAQPLVGAVLGVIVLGQALTLNIWAGGLLIGGGVLFAIYPLERLRRRITTQSAEP